MEEPAATGSSSVSSEKTNSEPSQLSVLVDDGNIVENSLGASDSTAQFPAPTKEEVFGDTWAYLKNFYVWVEKRPDDSKTYKCLLCQPKEVRIRSYPSTLHHLRSHVKRHHGDRLQDFEVAARQGRHRGGKRPGGSMEAAAKRGQPLISGWATGAGSGALQSGVNKRIVDLFVGQMLSLQVKKFETNFTVKLHKQFLSLIIFNANLP